MSAVSTYKYVTLSPFDSPIFIFGALRWRLFEDSEIKELPEAMPSVTSVPVGDSKFQMKIYNRTKPIKKPSQIAKSHSEDGSYTWSIRL